MSDHLFALRQRIEQVLADLGELTPVNDSEAGVQRAFVTALRAALETDTEEPTE